MFVSATKNFFLGALAGLTIGFIFTVSISPLREYIRGPLDRCMAIYLNIPPEMKNDPELIETIKKEGFKSFEALVESRCEGWIKNGQQF
jgi:hypothetical protein